MDDALTRLRRHALAIYGDALADADPALALRRALRLEGESLIVADARFDLRAAPLKIYSVALGKAARAMASALEELLGERLVGGVISAPPDGTSLPPRWRDFAGGHPTPNEASLAAADAAFDLLRRADADAEAALLLFLVTGGGSAMLERPRDPRVTLADLREANRLLVSCGASISEVNVVRRALSAVKGGGLARLAPRAAQITLIISDTNAGDETSVASGPTLAPPAHAPDAASIVARYRLETRLPASVLDALERREQQHDHAPPHEPRHGNSSPDDSSREGALSSNDATRADDAPRRALRKHFVLLDNARAVSRAARAARELGYVVVTADDLGEQPVEEAAPALVARAFGLWNRDGGAGRAVCLVSGGEFACPVRGNGVGGRNAETALRCAFELDALDTDAPSAVALSAGTDGIDGNSPAAGALADTRTLARARALGLNPRRFLDSSDAHTFFQTLGQALHTGPTGTNVRDLRLLLISES
ncbi:MAG TPA: DUF4147 domain-containing protein [Pyrinomonadaceae bacterium]|nr:DUF4147 domain-containing protein [Pyrinomonadaceae bacterium]